MDGVQHNRWGILTNKKEILFFEQQITCKNQVSRHDFMSLFIADEGGDSVC